MAEEDKRLNGWTQKSGNQGREQGHEWSKRKEKVSNTIEEEGGERGRDTQGD